MDLPSERSQLHIPNYTLRNYVVHKQVGSSGCLSTVLGVINLNLYTRFRRPAWSTGILIPAGFLCGIGAAVLIWRGGERTKRVEEVRERLRAALAAEAPVSRTPSVNGTTLRKAVAQLSPVMEREQSDVIPLRESISRRTTGRVYPPSDPSRGEVPMPQLTLTQTKSRGGTGKGTDLKPLPPMPPDSPELAIDESMTIPSLKSSTV